MPLTERKLIQRVRQSAPGGRALVTGIGDDCAVLRLPPGSEVLVTTDFSLENVHFRRDWHRPEFVGWRCLTRGLSDIAAMGGQPLAAFLSLAIARETPSGWVDGFLKGLLDLAGEFKVPLAGGDTAQSPAGIQADIVVVGSVPRGTAVLRSGANPGDSIYVTGELGGAAAELAQLRRARRKAAGRASPARFMPRPRLAVGQWLRKRGVASAMIDLSDGLSTDLEHLCEESHVGAEIDAAAIPRSALVSGKQRVTLDQALHGGEDYELLFTTAAKMPAIVAGVPVTRIGKIRQGSGMRIVLEGKVRPLEAGGWQHFSDVRPR